jgi:hypothetical protein
VATHQDLGSGMAIAMKDLEIRGAGNLLGADQSGPRRPGRLRHVHAAAGRGRGRAARPPHRGSQGAEAGGPGRRPPARRLRAPRAPAPGGLPPPGRGPGRRGGRGPGAELADRYGPPPPRSATCLELAGSVPRPPPSASPSWSASAAGPACSRRRPPESKQVRLTASTRTPSGSSSSAPCWCPCLRPGTEPAHLAVRAAHRRPGGPPGPGPSRRDRPEQRRAAS